MRFLLQIKRHRLCLSLLLLVVGLGCVGCDTMDADNTSARPWNSPDGWQNGSIPSGMMQPH
jgi:hypothetical protein